MFQFGGEAPGFPPVKFTMQSIAIYRLQENVSERIGGQHIDLASGAAFSLEHCWSCAESKADEVVLQDQDGERPSVVTFFLHALHDAGETP